MKNIKKHTIFLRLTLGIFLGMFLFVSGTVGAEEAAPCSTLKSDQTGCEARYDCRWRDAWVDQEEVRHESDCVVGAEVCRSVNDRDTLEDPAKKVMCESKECWWNDAAGVCRPVAGMCTGRTWVGCTLDSDCRWLDGECMLRAAKQDEQAAGAIERICIDAKGAKRNDFWIEEIPDPCIRPVTNQEIQFFCEQNAENLTPYGKGKCREAISHVLAAAQQKCLDDSEMRYQRSLKDSDAREQRRAEDAACRANVAEVYSGPVFSGGGLRSGAILAHENLTKSISHETDLKALVLGWTKFVLELVAILAVLAVVWAGILYITDMGDGGNQEKAKKILIWVAVGILVILGSYAIVNALMTADLGSSRAEIVTSFDA
jgi:hypothetical protein